MFINIDLETLEIQTPGPPSKGSSTGNSSSPGGGHPSQRAWNKAKQQVRAR